MDAELISPYWPVIYSLAGGLIALMGQLVSEWIQSKRSTKESKREVRRQQVYALQDQVITLFDLTRKYVTDITDPFNPQSNFYRSELSYKCHHTSNRVLSQGRG